MSQGYLEHQAEHLYEYLRRRISGCSICETGHDPRSHGAPPLPELSNIGQEITWVCENGHRHFLDVLSAATSIRLDGTEIAIFDAHMTPSFTIRVVPPTQTTVERRPDGMATFTIRARDAAPRYFWWEYLGRADEKREAIQEFNEAVIYAKAEPQADENPMLRCIHEATIISGDYFSWGCKGGDILRRLQAKTLEEQAQKWEDNNLRQQVGEAVIQAALKGQGGPGQVILKFDGGQVNILVNPLSGDNLPTLDGARVVDAEELGRMVEGRAVQGPGRRGNDGERKTVNEEPGAQASKLVNDTMRQMAMVGSVPRVAV